MSDMKEGLDITLLKKRLFSRANYDRALSETPSSTSAVGYYLTHLFRGLGSGYAFLLMFDRRMKLVKTVCLKKAGCVSHDSTFEKVNRAVAEYSPHYIAVAHNHKGGPEPSPSDSKTTFLLSEKYRGDSPKFLGHFIVSGLDYMLLTDATKEYRSYE